MRKRLAALAAAASLLPAPAGAQYGDNNRTLATSGYWSAMTEDANGRAITCKLVTHGEQGYSVSIGVNGNSDGSLIVLLYKPSWQVPVNMYTQVSLQIDDNRIWSGPNDAEADASNEGHGIYMKITDGMTEFFNEIEHGNTMTVRFSGNEPPWTIHLNGIFQVMAPFFGCVAEIMPQQYRGNSNNNGGGYEPPTQPYAHNTTVLPPHRSLTNVNYVVAQAPSLPPGTQPEPGYRAPPPAHHAERPAHRRYARRHYYRRYYYDPGPAIGAAIVGGIIGCAIFCRHR